ncbi:hypothetical protein lbkm_2752 [Lachnospiraceae bacterium KM106-2]|nr:hypothetical protein lbkm_2752 [Lachnospiraceae bacterium KM106-2]
MLEGMARGVTKFMIRQNVVKEEEQEMYDYCFELMLSTIMNLVVILVLSVLTHTFVKTLIFIAFFVPIRSIAGGFHASTHFRCLMTLVMVYTIFVLSIYFMPQTLYLGVGMTLLLLVSIAIWILAPVESSNKPLSEKEKIYLAKKCKVYLIVFAAIAVFFLWNQPLCEYGWCMTYAIGAVGFSVIYGKQREV